ncbi:hypothetical protein JCM8547_005983 [Rhodosporidiobolus lusitaniae]
MVKRVAVISDFDWSACDQDTDRYVFEVLAPHLRTSLRASKGKVQWTDSCAEHLRKLHAEGFRQKDIEHAMQICPFHPAMTRMIKSIKASSSPLVNYVILSNSNTFYIDTILKHNGIDQTVDEVITNPASFNEEGVLVLKRRVDPSGPQHTCKVGCSPNMCKGDELEAWMERNGGWDAFDQVIYVGDGGNDLCPVLHLRPQDVVLARSYRELFRRLEDKTGKTDVKCQVVHWGGAWEVEQFMLKVLEEKK